MTLELQQRLGKTLWAIADELRGSMNADDFRDYMLSLLFFRYLSDNYEAKAKELLKTDYPPAQNGKHPLVLFYEKNSPEDLELFEKEMREKVHYMIKPQYLWASIVELARIQDERLLNTLREAFKHIENESFESEFHGLFSEINLDSEKLGKDYAQRNAKLCTILQQIANGLAEFDNSIDILGDAYEYLIGQFAAGSGKKAGEFYTPQKLSDILSGIVILDCQDPSKGARKKLEKVLDFACGSGSLLLNVRRKILEAGGEIGKIYGQEKNITTYNLCRMNMLLHKIKSIDFTIFHGDTLTNEWNILQEMNPAKKMEFDAVVANPPFSLKWNPKEDLKNDFRFKDYGLAPKNAADFAFVLHGLHFLSREGTMAIILPHGVLFREGVEEQIRKKLIEDGNIDTVIGLPENLFYSTSIPVCILVLKKCTKFEDILFINASEYYEKGKNQNTLLEEHIQKIIETYMYRKEEPHYSRRVSLEEIRENGYNLNISRYVSTSKEEETINLEEVGKELKRIYEESEKTLKLYNQFLKELKLEQI